MELEKPRGLSASRLKYGAIIFMLIDHTDAVFHLLGGVAAPESLLYYLPRFLGRLSFPIFLFFVAEGCRKTRDFPAYLKRLFLFALLSQLPFTLAFGSWGGNIMFTLFLGALGIFCYEALCGRATFAVRCLPAAGFALLGALLNTDYGWIGVAMLFLLYLCGERRKRQIVCLALCLFALYFLRMPDWSHWRSFGLPYAALMTLCAWSALIPLYFYSGARGTGNKWFFYWFYPLHLLALWALKSLILA